MKICRTYPARLPSSTQLPQAPAYRGLQLGPCQSPSNFAIRIAGQPPDCTDLKIGPGGVWFRGGLDRTWIPLRELRDGVGLAYTGPRSVRIADSPREVVLGKVLLDYLQRQAPDPSASIECHTR